MTDAGSIRGWPYGFVALLLAVVLGQSCARADGTITINGRPYDVGRSYDYSRYYDYTYRPPVGNHYVNGYFRSDGSYVQGHYKTNRDDSFWNNWSSQGNINPYTGKTGYKLPPSTPSTSYYRAPSTSYRPPSTSHYRKGR
jgi:hypothetical protein